jgi:hypothetical protein
VRKWCALAGWRRVSQGKNEGDIDDSMAFSSKMALGRVRLSRCGGVAMNIDAALRELLPLVEGASKGEPWTNFLDAFRPHVRASQAVLTLIDLEGGGVKSRVSTSGVSAEAASIYMQNWATQDPWVVRAPRQAPLGFVRVSHELCPDEELESLPVYREFLWQYGWHYGAGVVVANTAGLHGILSFSRPKSEGPVQPDEQELLARLQPHISACLERDAQFRLLAEG